VWSEVPIWVPSKKMLLFSDVPENKIYQWQEGDTARVFLFPSGYTDTAARDGENGSNGLTLDKNGSLLLCQSGNRHVSRLSASLDKPIAVFEVLSRGYNGKKFNSPNDLVTDRAGNIFFTDPIYGLPQQENDPTRELQFEGVYKIDASGKTTLLIDSISRPNGVALSPDQTILYIGSSDADKPRWYAYKLNEHRQVVSGGILLDAIPLKNEATVKQGPDGLKIDDAGNLYSSGPDGINILSPTGKRLALIRVFNRPTSNCAFNESKDMLYITADDLVLRVKLK
jgi:gluconolactonase